MNDERIEQLLRKGPVIRPPADLLEKLKRDIRVPQMEAGYGEAYWSSGPSRFKRWIPALAFGVILVSCLVAIGVQMNMLANLRRQNEELRATTRNLDALRTENAEFQRLTLENGQLERLHKDNAELQKLKGQVAQFTDELKDIETVRTEHKRLEAAIAAHRITGPVAEDASVKDEAEAESIRCTSNLKQIGLAFRIWSGDNGDHYPMDFISMTNELNNPRILHCPSDRLRTVTTWADVAAGNISYVRVSSGPGADETHPTAVLVQCPIHGHILLSDGSVLRGSPEVQQRMKVVNGVTILTP